jgi:hypothetical protein
MTSVIGTRREDERLSTFHTQPPHALALQGRAMTAQGKAADGGRRPGELAAKETRAL